MKQSTIDYIMNNGYVEQKKESQHTQCPICYENQEFYVFNPCGHICCIICVDKIPKQYKNRCYICRNKIESKIKVKS